jgi:hypothetical protein
MGGVPAPGDTVEVDGLRLTVETTDNRRVGKVLVTRQLDKGSRPADEDGEGLPANGASSRRADRRGSGKR